MRTPTFLLAATASLALLASAARAAETVATEAGPVAVTEVASGLDHPWGIAFLPDGRMLVTEREGRLRVVSPNGTLSEPLSGVPEVHARGQGGLLDVALDPGFAENRLVYLTYSEPGDGGLSGTAAARGRLSDDATALEDVEVIFRQEPKTTGNGHYGSRLAFAPDGKLFITTGERQKFDPAQDLQTHFGKVIRVNPDGSVPQDNPFVGRDGAQPEIWSYGHRNPQGAAIHPATGALWIHEMGPQGGDELNIPQKGANYGWPLVSWGDHYGGEPIPRPDTRPDLAGSVTYWNPVIAPSGMAFYTADLFADWRGDLLIGGLRSGGLVRLDLDGERVTDEERIPLGARIRDVEIGLDGAVYVATDEDDGRILRLAPAD